MMKNGNEKLKFIVWQKIHLLPAWCIDLWQKWKFRTIVKHAYEKIPLYRALWQEKGIIEKNIKKVSIRALPIISKNNFTERNTDEYICQDFPEQFYNWRGATSGSTGEPFKFVRASYGDGSPEVEKYYDSFKRWRFLVWDGISFDYIFNTLRGVRFQETSHLDLTTLLIKRTGLYQGTEKTVDRILNFKGEVIGGYSSGLVEFCTVLHNHDLVGAITFKYAASSGEVLLPSQRQFIEQTLGCEVYDRYGTEEFRIIGVECREHRGFHLNSESFILEVVDESGQL
ncbi:MAG: hypothetical protein Q8R36_00760, partial [bacterium]|nr:hypothetical protein [bacterium]